EQEGICRRLGDLDNLARGLAGQAWTRYAGGELGEALVLLREQEGICRELKDEEGLRFSLESQETVLRARPATNPARLMLSGLRRAVFRKIGETRQFGGH